MNKQVNGLNLRPDEGVVMTVEAVTMRGKEEGNGTLTLTNANIHLSMLKGIFNNRIETTSLPLSRIKVVSGVPQVSFLESNSIITQVDIYFIDGEYSLTFMSKRQAKRFAENVRKLKLGRPVDTSEEPTGILPELAENVAGTLKGTFGAFAKGWGSEATIEGPKEQSVTVQCPSCGATISGMKGSVVGCSYCGTQHTL